MKGYEETCLTLFEANKLYTEEGFKQAKEAFEEEAKDPWFAEHYYATAEWLLETDEYIHNFAGEARLAQMEIDVLNRLGYTRLAKLYQAWLIEATVGY